MRGSDGQQVQLRLHQEAARAARADRPSAGRFVTGEERMLALHEAHAADVAVSFDGEPGDAPGTMGS